ncbi:ankyrin repeat domain-containing protein [Flavobacterium hydrophilum]|uniref:Ankyrin repeat domain-containing protein n=1 Tax=Flavobacterium hydrophilum TaxID=2211445 RepID=A0A2V4CMX6_9FLAO|nr:ankyrin repeat domain-containing protein [Flavobacterium hydrophilum]PXY46994.1 hypothetical protein DMB68_07560 [Flavobacterium hydrophilum]
MKKINKNATLELFELADQGKYDTNDLEKIKILLSEGADPNFCQKDYPNETVLYRVVSSWEDKNRLEVVKMLLTFGVDFNQKSDIFYPIEKAVFNNDFALVQFMLENGADQGLDYSLKSAIEKNNIDLVTLLLKYNINLNEFEPYAKSYLIFSCEAYRIRDKSTLYETQPEIAIAKLLIHHGIDVNGLNHEESPILEAIRHNFYDLVELLLENGAVLSTEVRASIWVNTPEMFQFLVEKGIIKDLNEIIFPREQTPLMHHIIQSNFDIAKYLIENNANLYHTDKHKKTAFHYAVYTENSAFIDYLLDYFDVKKCHEISSVLDGTDNKNIINKLKAILDTTILN